MKWISNQQTYPQRWGLKRDIPLAWQHWAKRAHFRFETVWIVVDENGLVSMPDGGWAPTFSAYLKTPGLVIGLRDMTTADLHDWAEEWRAVMAERVLARMGAQ